MNSKLLAFLCVCFLTACDAVQDMQGLFEKQALIQTAVRDKYGWDVQVGWNMHNGILTQVTLGFVAEQVRHEAVSTLERAALDAVAQSFKSTPNAIVISIITEPPSNAE